MGVKSELRLKTRSRKYVIRFFMFVLSVLLYNAWILLNLLYGFFNFLVVFTNPVIEAQKFGISCFGSGQRARSVNSAKCSYASAVKFRLAEKDLRGLRKVF